MPFRWIVAFCFIAPLIGIFEMEAGAYGASVMRRGFPNGASIAFALGACAFLVTIILARQLNLFSFARLKAHTAPNPSARIWLLAVAALAIMAFFTLFVSDGIDVVMRSLGRGDFRASLGDTGAISYLILKYYSPAILAYLVILYARRPWYDAIIPLSVPLILVALIAASFGFKSGILLAFMPAAVLYFWRIGTVWIIPLGLAALAAIYVGYTFFDELSDPSIIIAQLSDRLTILQGDVAWKIWGLHANGESLPSYAATLPGILGDRALTLITGIGRTDTLDWVLTHFGLLITYISGYPTNVIMAGHNNTATIFSEGVLIGGLPGVLAISMAAGLLTTALYNFIAVCLERHRIMEAALASSYFIFALMAWLLGGGVTAIVHISIVVGIASGYGLLRIIEGRHRSIGVEAYAT